MIEFQNVTVRDQGKTILKNITFTITKHEKTVLYGKSGSGKSTILYTLLGGHILLEGSIKFDGCLVNRHSINNVRSCIAFIGQEPFLGEGTIEHVLLLPFTFKVNAMHLPNRLTLSRILDQVGLPDSLLDCDAASVSGGEKQRIAVARALLLKKDVFLIDEATSALDFNSAEIIISLFRDERFTILSVSHDPRWLTIANRFIKIDNGTIVSDSRDRSVVEN